MKRYLTLQEAEAMLKDGDTIHCFKNPGVGVLVGAYWSRAEVLKYLEAGKPEIAGPMAVNMGHALACDGSFFETKREWEESPDEAAKELAAKKG